MIWERTSEGKQITKEKKRPVECKYFSGRYTCLAAWSWEARSLGEWNPRTASGQAKDLNPSLYNRGKEEQKGVRRRQGLRRRWNSRDKKEQNRLKPG